MKWGCLGVLASDLGYAGFVVSSPKQACKGARLGEHIGDVQGWESGKQLSSRAEDFFFHATVGLSGCCLCVFPL